MEVVAGVVERAELVLQLLDEFREPPLARHHHLHDRQPDVDTIALGHVPLHRDPARLLAADEHVAVDDLRRDVLEPDRRRLDREAVVLAHPVEHVRGREGLDDSAVEPLLFVEVLHKEREDLVRVHEPPLLVHHPDAVGVTVEGESDVAAALGDDAREVVEVALDGLRRLPVHAGVVLVVHLDHVVAAEEVGDGALPRAVHRVAADLQPGAADALDVEVVAEHVAIRLAEVDRLDQPVGFERVVGFQLEAVVEPVELLLDLGDLLGEGRAAEGGFDLEAVVARRVVARRDHDAGVVAVGLRGPAHARRRDERVGELDADAGGGEHAGDMPREGLALKPRVVADHGGGRALGTLSGNAVEPLRGGTGDAFEISEGVTFCDDGAPAVGAELDGGHAISECGFRSAD